MSIKTNGRSVRVLHAAVFSDGQVPACRLQIFLALVVALAGLQALGGGLVGGSHGTVAGDVFLGVLVVVGLRVGQGTGEQHGGQGESSEKFFHGKTFRLSG